MSVENYTCKKVAFATEENAEFYIKKLQRTSIRLVKPQRAYLCEKCLRWHLTHIQTIDLRCVEKENEKLKSENLILKQKTKEQEQIINNLNNAIIEFRMPKKPKTNGPHHLQQKRISPPKFDK